MEPRGQLIVGACDLLPHDIQQVQNQTQQLLSDVDLRIITTSTYESLTSLT